MTDMLSKGSDTPLQQRILVPLLSTALLCLGLLGWMIHREFRAELARNLQIQTEHISGAVATVVESVAQIEQIQRIVNAVGSERNVMLIVVAAGDPLKILASTRNAWVGEPVSNVREVRQDASFIECVSSGKACTLTRDSENEYAVSIPLLLTQSSLTGNRYSNGAVLVHLDIAPTRQRLLQTTLTLLGLSILAIGLLTLTAYWLLSRYVLRPLRQVLSSVELSTSPHPSNESSVIPCANEIDHLAHVLNSALRELKQQKDALDEHAIVSITDTTGKILYVNSRFSTISGYSLEELQGKNHRIISSGMHGPEFFKEMWDTILGGRIWRGELCNKTRDGSLYWVSSTVVPFHGQDGTPSRFVAILTDITALKKAQASLQTAKDEAETLADRANAASRAKGEFLAMMSHEIRTPMNGVIGFTNLLLDTRLDSEQKGFASTIKNSGEALLSIINDILDYSKMEAGRMTLEPVWFCLQEASREVLGLLSNRALEKGLDLVLKVSGTVPSEVFLDAGRTRQILLNLIGNAIKFTSKGSVTLEIDTASQGLTRQFFLSDRFPQGHVLVRVTDTGIGIPKEALGRLFQMFTQADSSTSRKFGGTGLGLAISRQLTEMMGGVLQVDSEPGRGSTFWFLLPLPSPQDVLERAHQREQESKALHENTAEAPLGQPKSRGLTGARILLSEDNRTNQVLATHLLKKMGLVVDVANNGVEAVFAYKQRPYDLILMDCQMPEKDGFEATREIRALEPEAGLSSTNRAIAGRARTPIIALTANAMKGDRERCLEAGMDDYLTKPIRSEALKATLEKWILTEEAERNALRKASLSLPW